jgi:hypothetical protein
MFFGIAGILVEGKILCFSTSIGHVTFPPHLTLFRTLQQALGATLGLFSVGTMHLDSVGFNPVSASLVFCIVFLSSLFSSYTCGHYLGDFSNGYALSAILGTSCSFAVFRVLVDMYSCLGEDKSTSDKFVV